MAIDIVLSDSASGRPDVRLGPFEDIRLQHRRLLADGTAVVRHHDGGWHFEGHSFLRATVTASPRERLTVVFAKSEPVEKAHEIVLFADRLILQPGDRTIAFDDDDWRCWVSARTGLVNDHIRVDAA